MFFPAGVNPNGTNLGYPLGIDPAALLILIACLTFTPYAPTVTATFIDQPIAVVSFLPQPVVTATFASPVVTATWLSVLSSVTFTPSPIAKATFYDHHSACPAS